MAGLYGGTLASSDYGEVVCRWFESRLWTVNFGDHNDFNRRYGLNLSERNILIPGESKPLFFMLLMPLAATPAADS